MKKIMVLCMVVLMIVPGVSATFGGDFCEVHPELCDFDICEFIPSFCLDPCDIHPGLCDPVCGDGHLEHPEECDDGNHENGDGCSSHCTHEQPEEVPEFTTLGALAALGGAGYFMYRRRK